MKARRRGVLSSALRAFAFLKMRFLSSAVKKSETRGYDIFFSILLRAFVAPPPFHT
jgi:hypothetical protein